MSEREVWVVEQQTATRGLVPIFPCVWEREADQQMRALPEPVWVKTRYIPAPDPQPEPADATADVRGSEGLLEKLIAALSKHFPSCNDLAAMYDCGCGEKDMYAADWAAHVADCLSEITGQPAPADEMPQITVGTGEPAGVGPRESVEWNADEGLRERCKRGADGLAVYFEVDWGTNDINGTEKFTVDTPKIAVELEQFVLRELGQKDAEIARLKDENRQLREAQYRDTVRLQKVKEALTWEK